MSVTIGIAQGIVPLAGYNHSAGKYQRTRDIVKFALLLSVGFSIVCVLCYEIFAGHFVSLFIKEAVTVSYSSAILRIMCISTPLMAVGFIMITAFQATGLHRQGTVLSVLRKGAVDIPIMIIANAVFPLMGIAGAQPIAEVLQ